MEQIRRDMTAAVRSLRSRPGTSLLAVTALALGIGLTSTMFSIVDGVFLRGLPFDGGDRLLYVGVQDARLPERRPRDMPVNDYLEVRAAQRSFEDLGAFDEFGADVAADGVAPRHYQAARMTASAFALLRVRPLIGRALADADAAEGAPPVVVISESAWRGQFDGDAGIVGRIVRINRVATTVIGVMPAGFGFPHDEDLWLPLRLRPAVPRASAATIQAFGRLRDGVSIDAANVDLATVVARIAPRESSANLTGTAVPYVGRFIDRRVRSTLSMMLVAVFGVLLIACFNVTNLLLARAAERVREIGIRLAIGASRWRVMRQLLLEGLLLAAAGEAAGIAIAVGGVRFFNVTMADSSPPFWIDVRVDARVVLFSSALAAGAAIASSLVPALRASRIGPFSVLKDGDRATAGLRMVRFSRSLVIAEIVLSFALLIVSGLLIKSIVAATRIEMPFRTDLLHARLSFPSAPYTNTAAVRQATERLLDLLTAEPGVTAAAMLTVLPDNAGGDPLVTDAAPPDPDSRRRPRVRAVAVTPGFFDAVGLAPVQGRRLDATDRADGPPVAVVSAELAQRFFPGGALGRRIQVGSEASAPWRTIVGVVPRLVYANTNSASAPTDTVLLPLAQAPARRLTLLVAAGDLAQAAGAARRAMTRLDPDLPLGEVTTIARVYHDQSWPIRLFGTVFAAFGLSALLLASAGLYGVMSFAVRRRTRELGVRMALGATPSGVVLMLLRQGSIMLGAGMALGFGIGGWLGQQLELFLFAVKPWDASVLIVITLVLGATGLIATLVPAWRAASIDPMVALRES